MIHELRTYTLKVGPDVSDPAGDRMDQDNDGSLGESQSFKDVVSHADEAQGVMYVSLQNGWIEALNDLAADEKDPELVEALDNLGALQAMGASTWNEGDIGHGLLRLSMK